MEYNSEYKYEMLHNRLLQDKEMTVRLDWSKWTCVPAENSLSLLSLLLLFFYRDLIYIHYTVPNKCM